MTPDQMRALSSKMLATADWVRDELPDLAEEMEAGRIALRAAADQLEAVQALLTEANDKFAATYDAERLTGRGPSSIGVAGAPLASSVQRALDLLRAKATANIERLTAGSAPQEPQYEECGIHGFNFNDDCGWCFVTGAPQDDRDE